MGASPPAPCRAPAMRGLEGLPPQSIFRHLNRKAVDRLKSARLVHHHRCMIPIGAASLPRIADQRHSYPHQYPFHTLTAPQPGFGRESLRRAAVKGQRGWLASTRASRPRHFTSPAGSRGQAASVYHHSMTTLCIWDFDWSLIEENSDTFVISEIGAHDIYTQLRAQGLPWTALMDATLQAAHRQLGVSEADVLAALARTPLHPSVAEAIRALGGSGRVESIVVSDANTVYVDAILQQHGLKEFFGEVHTNPAAFEGGALRVRPYDPHPASCHRLCPVNLCKGRVVRDFLARQHKQGKSYAQVVYIGDGRGDWCPTVELLLTPGLPSVVLARSQYPDGVPCALWVKLRSSPGEHAQQECGGGAGGGGGEPQQRVVGWSTAPELAQQLLQLGGLAGS